MKTPPVKIGSEWVDRKGQAWKVHEKFPGGKVMIVCGSRIGEVQMRDLRAQYTEKEPSPKQLFMGAWQKTAVPVFEKLATHAFLAGYVAGNTIFGPKTPEGGCMSKEELASAYINENFQ